MKRYNYLIVAIFVFIINTSQLLKSQVGSTNVLKRDYNQFHTIFLASFGSSIGQTSSDFFTTYNSLIHGSTNSFNSNMFLNIGLKFHFIENFRLGIETELLNFDLNDSFEELTDPLITDSPHRTIVEEIHLNTIPVFFNIEYIPYNIQFRTYFGSGIGIVINSLVWNEFINSNKNKDIRVSGKHIDNLFFSPALKLYTGMELGFDKEPYSRFLGSLYFQFNINYIFRNTEFFSKISEQFENIKNIETKTQLIPFYFILNIGITIAVYAFCAFTHWRHDTYSTIDVQVGGISMFGGSGFGGCGCLLLILVLMCCCCGCHEEPCCAPPPPCEPPPRPCGGRRGF